MRSTLRRALMAVALSGLATHSLVAQAEKIPRFRLTVGVVFARLQTSVRYDIGNGLIGLRVGFEKVLGLAEFQTFPTVQALYRVGGRHHVVGGYYNLGRKGTNQISVDLPLPDTTLTIGTTVESDFDTRVFTLGYGYSLLQTPTTSITPYVALYLADWEAGISSQGTAGGRVGEVGLTAPLPMLGLGVYTGVAKRLFLGGNLGLFFLKVGDYEGSIVEINAYLTYQLLSFLSLGGGYTAFSVDVQSEAPDFRGEIRYRFDGPSLSTTVSF